MKTLLRSEDTFLQNIEPIRRLLNSQQTPEDLDPYRIRDMLQLMDYSLDQYNPIRAEVIRLIQNPEARRGNLDIITLMSRGFGGPTDSNALMTIAAEI